MYRYFISYMMHRTDHSHTFGRCQIERDTEIMSIEDIRGIEEKLDEKPNCTHIVLNYRLMAFYKEP